MTPLAYWHDSNEERYRRGSTFLALINNENKQNSDYVKNLQSLKRLVLVKYENDVSLIPNESAWFGFEDERGNVRKMEDNDVYLKDKLGLKKMDQEGRLIRLLSPLEHLQLNQTWFRENIVPILTEQ